MKEILHLQESVDDPDVQPGERVSFIATDGDRDEREVDAVAGSEFVDDQIRLDE